MATGGEDTGQCTGSVGSEDLDQLKCQPCLEDGNLHAAVGMCIDCQDYLCSQCFKIHTLPKPMRNHKLLDREQMLQSEICTSPKDVCTEMCSVHEDEILKYYCTTHCLLGCTVCITLDHATCKGVQYIPCVAKELTTNDEYRQVKRQLKTAVEAFEKVAKNVEQNAVELEKTCTEALDRMKDYRRKVEEALDKLEAKLVEQARSIKSTDMEELAALGDTYKIAHDEVQGALAKIEALHKAKQNCSLYIEMMRTKDKLKSMEAQIKSAEMDKSYRECKIKFAPNQETLESLQNSDTFGLLSGSDKAGNVNQNKVTIVSANLAGNIKVTTGTGDNTEVDKCDKECQTEFALIKGELDSLQNSDTLGKLPGSDERATVNQTTDIIASAKHAGKIKVKTWSDDKTCWITGLVILPSGILVIADFSWNSNLKSVNVESCEVLAELKLSHGPWDVTAITNNKVAVTLPGEKKIAIVSVGDNSLSWDRNLNVNGQCRGIDYRNGKLAVSFCDPDKVQVLNLQGAVLYTIPAKQRRKSLFNAPNYLTFGQDDTTLYVSNTCSNNVICVKLDGTVVATYRHRDLVDPHKPVIDKHGNVYVCTYGSNQVHQFSKDCQKMQVLLTRADGLHQPFSICLSAEDDKLYVGMLNNGNVKVYKTEHKTQ